MSVNIQGFNVNWSQTRSISNTYDYSENMNNSARLRHHFKHYPLFLKKFKRIIIVAPQPLGKEALRTVSLYINTETTSVYRLFFLPQPTNLKDDLLALRSLLETDLELEKLKRSNR